MGMAAILINELYHFSNISFSCSRSNTGSEASEEKPFEIINIFSIQMYGTHTNAYRSKLDLAVKKVKCQCMTIPLAILVDRPFQMIYAKIQPQAILGF